jgi:hypothetical protein
MRSFDNVSTRVTMNSRTEAIGLFWDWFQFHATQLRGIRSSQSAEYAEIERRLKKIGDVYFEIGGGPETTYLELVLTAHGNRDGFPLIDAIAAAAPRIEGWRICALKPPLLENLKIVFEGQTVESQHLWVKLASGTPSPGKPTLFICCEYFDEPSSTQAWAGGAWILVESYLGERAFASELGEIEFVKRPVDPADEGFLRVDELARRLGVHLVQ